ncbi:MAG: AsmA family protein [Magnetococcus sp. YQC-9]
MMNPTLKRRVRVAAVVMGLVLIAAIAVPVLVHPNQYRAPIGALVKSATGRALTIRGDLGLAFFPSLELILRDLVLEEDPAFGTEPLAVAQSLVVGVKFVPLLSGRVEMDRVELRGLHLHLKTREDGRANWEEPLARLRNGNRIQAESASGSGVGSPGAASNNPHSVPESLVSRLLGMSIGGIELSSSSLTFRDVRTASELLIEPLELKTGPIHPGRPVAVASSFRFIDQLHAASGRVEFKSQMRALAPGRVGLEGVSVQLASAIRDGVIKEVKGRLQGELEMDMRARQAAWSRLEVAANLWSDREWLRELALGYQGRMEIDLTSGRLAAPKIATTLLIKSARLPPAGVQARLAADLSADPWQRVWALDNVEIEGPAGLKVTGAMQGAGQPAVIEGTLDAQRFDFRALLIALGRTIPAPADGKVCAGAEAEVAFVIRDREWSLPRLSLGVDDAHVSGSAGWSVDQPKVRFDLRADTLDLNRFVPLLSGGGAVNKGEGGEDGVIAWPDRAWQIEGVLRAGQLITPKGELSELETRIVAQDGVMRIDPLSYGVNGGRVGGRLELDQRDGEPVLRLEQEARGVRFGPYVKDWFATTSSVDGVASWTTKVTTRGRERLALWRNLTGEARLEMKDGVIVGMDLVGKVRQAHAAFLRQRVSAVSMEESRFADLVATFQMGEGRWSSTDLVVSGPDLKMTGTGEVDCGKRRVDAQLQVDVVTALRGVVTEVERYQGLMQPWVMRGALEGGRKFEAGGIDFSRVVQTKE